MYIVTITVKRFFQRKKTKVKTFGPFANHDQAGAFINGLSSWFINKGRLVSIEVKKVDDFPQA